MKERNISHDGAIEVIFDKDKTGFYCPSTKDVLSVSSQISQITKREFLLSPQTEQEVKRDIKNGRYVIIGNSEKIIGFSKTNLLAPNWMEISKSYVDPDYRRQGVYKQMKEEVISRNLGANLISITASPAVEYVNKGLGFERQKLHTLPMPVVKALMKEYLSSFEKVIFQIKNSFVGKRIWVRKVHIK